MKDELIQTLRPQAGKKNKRMSIEKYESIKNHLLALLGKEELKHTDLKEKLYAKS
jgi:hypothetical protein